MDSLNKLSEDNTKIKENTKIKTKTKSEDNKKELPPLPNLKIKEINNYKYMSIITGTYPSELSQAIPFYFNKENFKLFYTRKTFQKKNWKRSKQFFEKN